MGLFSLAYSIGATSQVDEEEARVFFEEFQELVKDIDAVGIFTHNATLALPMFIPGFGVAWGFFAAWSTGYAFSSLVTTIPELANIPPLAILYLSPFGIMELVAYFLGISRSFILIRMILKKVNLRPAVRGTTIEIGVMVALLFAGAFIEFYMISMVEEAGFEMPLLE